MQGRQLLMLLFAVVLITVLLDSAEYLALPDVENFFGNINGLYVDGKHIVKQIRSEDDLANPFTRNCNRIRRLKKYCAELGFSFVEKTTDIRAHISPNNTVLYCRVNKCASTMTLELLKKLFDCDTDCLIENAKLIKQDTPNVNNILRKAFSFIVVREPYSRILSTYSNIFYFPKEDWIYRSTKIIKQVRDKPSVDSLKYGHDLTFPELIKYIVDSYEKGLRIDEHVRPMSHKSCSPCRFSFDFVVKLETIRSDFEYLLHEWKMKKIVTYYDADVLSKLRDWTIYGPVKHLFRVIPLIKNSNISLYNVFLRAWSYYQITGHVWKHYPFPYNRLEIESITLKSFLTVLEKAIKSSSNASHDLNSQRIDAMKEAYSSVPMEDLNRLQRVVRSDCLLFGYDHKPNILVNLTSYSADNGKIMYFKGLY